MSKSEIIYPSRELKIQYSIIYTIAFSICEALLLVLFLPLVFNYSLLDAGDFILVYILIFLIIIIPLLYFRKRYNKIGITIFILIEGILLIMYLFWTKVFPSLPVVAIEPQVLFLNIVIIVSIINGIYFGGTLFYELMKITFTTHEIADNGVFRHLNSKFGFKHDFISYQNIRGISIRQGMIEKGLSIKSIELIPESSVDFQIIIEGINETSQVPEKILKLVSQQDFKNNIEPKKKKTL
ncbi:MAG: hypothetical protein ACTSX4_12625 [Candidatus Helarchaeota archaeon]